jgi:type IV pilus assembly protein PilB
MKNLKSLGKALVRSGVITAEQLREALEDQDGKSLARAIADKGFASEQEVTKALADASGLTFVDLSRYEIDPNAATLLSEEIARKYTVIPVKMVGKKLIVAVADPSNVLALDDLKIITQMDIEPVVATETDILSAIGQYSSMEKEVEELANFEDEAEEASASAAQVVEEVEREDAPIVKLVNVILSEAVRARAADVHIEPQERDIRIRYRIDGVLHDIMRSPKSAQLGMITRLKILANLDIAEKRLPQDGRFSLVVDNRPVDFRIATLPTIHGEKVVLRILEKESIMIPLESLGFLPESLETFKKSLMKPYGAIFVTGPTGSGKTTTLYAALNLVNSVEKNIITVEDPVEYRLAGCNQVQVNPKAGLTFAAALRSILRNDPDIVMIGEIRDRETALIAVESALTGHLVLSTLHTNDAPSAITRLTEMEIEPFLTASALDCIVAQRLARRLCDKCKEPYKPDKDFLKSVGYEDEDIEKIDVLYRARGCDYCSNTGYRGRTGVYEVMLLTEDIKALTIERASTDEIKKAALQHGMKTLRQAGLAKARTGETSVEEVLRVIV